MKKIYPVGLAVLLFFWLTSCKNETGSPSASEGGNKIINVKETLQKEAQRTKPDYITYIPKSFDFSTNDSHNEHFLVFNGPDGSMMTIWTQAVGIGDNGHRNRIVFSRSGDQGMTWTDPLHLVGPKTIDDPTNIASWAFPLVSKSGRIYVVFNRNIGVKGWIFFHTGIMEGMYSDDLGKTWSEPQQIIMPHSIYDDPEGKIPSEWIVWQMPMKDLDDNYFVGYSRWPNPKSSGSKEIGDWTDIESVVEFMRFVNVHKDPEPKDLKIEYSAWGEKALRVPHYLNPAISVTQEPSIVRLPDDRLFCVMRTNTGYIWYSESKDDGRTWTNPAPLLRKDYGEPIYQPVSCDPIYQLADGRYVLLHHSNTGNLEQRKGPRYPAYIALGEFRPEADQPVWFSDSKELMTSEGRGPDGISPSNSNNVGIYTSFTTNDGNNVLWHPDRKFYNLGIKITDEFLGDLHVPVME